MFDICTGLENLFNSNLQEHETVESVTEIGKNRYLIKLHYTDDNSDRKYVMELIDRTPLACLYVVDTCTVVLNSSVITFERVGECVNYFTYTEGVFKSADIKHIFNQIKREL